MSRLPEGWKLKKLKDFSKIVTGNTPRTKDKENFGNEYSWVTPTDINKTKYIYNTERKLSEIGFSKARQLPENTVLITSIASIGKNAILKVEGSCNQQINAILPSENHDSDFIYYWFDNNVQVLKNLSGQTAVPILNKTDFSNIKIPLPPIEEQKKIAEILSTVDEKIAFVDKSIEETQILKKGLIQKLLTEGIGHTEFKESELGRIPKEWEVVKLPILTNKITSGGTPSRKKPEYFKNGTVNWIKTGELRDNYIYGSSEKITEEAVSNSSAKIFPIDTLLIAMYGATIGRTAYLKTECTTNQACCAIMFNKEVADTHFFWQYFLFIKEDLILMGSGAGQPNISQGIIKDLLVVRPPLEEQKQIAEILSTTDEKLENLKAKKEAFEELKKGLMQKLLTGEIRV